MSFEVGLRLCLFIHFAYIFLLSSMHINTNFTIKMRLIIITQLSSSQRNEMNCYFK